MTEFLVYAVFPIVLFLLIKSLRAENQETRKAELEHQEKLREEEERWRIEQEKKSIHLHQKYRGIQIKDENPLLKLLGLEKYKD